MNKLEAFKCAIDDDRFRLGVETAWKYATKIVMDERHGGLSNKAFHVLFEDCNCMQSVFNNYTCEEVIEKIMEYEEKSMPYYEVGDEVIIDGYKYIVTNIAGQIGTAMRKDDGTFTRFHIHDAYIKTGKHVYNISLDAMGNR